MTDAPILDATPAEPGFGDFVQLLKPRVMSLVVFTALVGMLVAPVSMYPVEGFARCCSSPSGQGPRGRSTCGGMPTLTR